MIITTKKITKDSKEYVISKDLLTINLNNVGFIELLKTEDDINYLELQYRKRATFKTLKFILKHTESNLVSFFKNNNFYRLEKYFININNIVFIDENRNNDKIELVIYFNDGQEIIINTIYSRWENWKTLRL
jgi:hypothetical protein